MTYRDKIIDLIKQVYIPAEGSLYYITEIKDKGNDTTPPLIVEEQLVLIFIVIPNSGEFKDGQK